MIIQAPWPFTNQPEIVIDKRISSTAKRILPVLTFLLMPLLAQAQTTAVGSVQKADTIAALRALAIPTSTKSGRVVVAGYYTAGDKPAVQYDWDSTSAAKDDGGAFINPSAHSGPGRWRLDWGGWRANVRDWGAKGDNAADDLACINAAIKALPVNPYDNPVQSPGAGAGGTYRLGTVYLPPGNYRTGGTIYIGPRMKIELDEANISFMAGVASNVANEKFVIQSLYGSNTVDNPNTSFGVEITGRGIISAGSRTDNPGGSGVFFTNANFGQGLRGIIVGECALRGMVISCQGGNLDGVWIVGPIWRGPGLEVSGAAEQFVLGRISCEHINPGPISSDPAWTYQHDADGDLYPAMLIAGVRNMTVGDAQMEASPLAVKIKDSQCITINSCYDNVQGIKLPVGSQLVKISGDSENINLFGMNGPGLPNQIQDVSVSSGRSRNVNIVGPCARTTYVQDGAYSQLDGSILNATDSLGLPGGDNAHAINGTTQFSRVSTVGAYFLTNSSDYRYGISIAKGSHDPILGAPYGDHGFQFTLTSFWEARGYNAATFGVNGASVYGKPLARWVAVPASSTAAGQTGDIASDGTYLYICTGSGSWKRTAVSAW